MKRPATHFLMMAATILLVAGCAHQRATSVSTPTESETAVTDIGFQVGPCHGTCPVYSVDLQKDGTTRFTGEQFTAVEGERTKVSDPESFARVRQRLSAWQPAMGSRVETAETSNCGPRATDLSHYTVTWTRRDGETAVLEHDSGCRSGDARELTDVLRSLPETLDIKSWVQR